VEEDAEEDADTVSSSMVEPNPQPTRHGQQQQKIRIGVHHGIPFGDVGEEFHTGVGRTPQGFDTIDFESTQMHARLNCRHHHAVDPS